MNLGTCNWKMAELLKTKTKIRSDHRAHTSKVIDQCKQLLKNFEPGLKTKLKTLKATLLEKEQTLKNLDDSIIKLVDEEEILKEIEIAANFTEQIKEIVIDIEEKLKLNDQQENEKTAANSSSAVATSKSGKLAYARLPKLVIKRFGSQACNWIEFWDTFVNSHMDHLLNLTPVTDSRDLWKLRKLYDTIEQDVQGLESLGVPVTSYGSLFVSVVQSRLPTDILIEIGKV